jgi:putative protease
MATKKTKKAKKPVKKTVKKSAKKPAKKVAKKPAKKAVKKIAKRAKPLAKKPVKKARKLPGKAENNLTPAASRKTDVGKQVGKILHYFDRISVAVVELDGDLFVGDAIRVIGGEETDFKQVVESMELEHEKIGKAKKGQAIGVELKDKAREGYKVYKI